jgi:SAM-dependent methyltransferase
VTKAINNILIEKFISDEFKYLKSIYKNAVFLDIGCGDMRYMKHCTKQGWCSIFSDYEIRNRNISIQLDSHKLPFRDSSFDIILMSEVLEHLHHPSDCLKEISRILKPEGTLLITVPFMWGLHEVPNDYFRYTEFGLKIIMTDVGLNIERFQRRGDIIGLLVSQIHILVVGGIKVLCRRRILLLLGFPLWLIVKILEQSIFTLYLITFNKRSETFFEMPGAGLKGILGHLRHWHLGLNVVCKKNNSGEFK